MPLPSSCSARGLRSCVLALGLVSAPGCRPEPQAVAPSDPARGSDFVQAGPVAAPAVAAAPRPPTPPLQADVGGERAELAPPLRAPAGADPIADALRREVDTTGLPRRGAPDPTVTIVECSDFDCPFCARVVPTLDELLANHPGDVALFYRHLPLPFHPGAEPAARAAVAAHAQGKFWALHDLLFENPRMRSDAELEALAKKAGVNVKQWRKAFRSKETAAQVRAQSQACGANDVSGTPGFLINGRLLSGARPLADFEAVVAQELRRPR